MMLLLHTSSAGFIVVLSMEVVVLVVVVDKDVGFGTVSIASDFLVFARWIAVESRIFKKLLSLLLSLSFNMISFVIPILLVIQLFNYDLNYLIVNVIINFYGTYSMGEYSSFFNTLKFTASIGSKLFGRIGCIE